MLRNFHVSIICALYFSPTVSLKALIESVDSGKGVDSQTFGASQSPMKNDGYHFGDGDEVTATPSPPQVKRYRYIFVYLRYILIVCG